MNISTISPILLAAAVKHFKYRILERIFLEVNHKLTLGIAAIVTVVAVVLTAVSFAIPQQALAHSGHHHHNHNSNNIKVDQNATQANFCDNRAQCLNTANNIADIHR